MKPLCGASPLKAPSSPLSRRQVLALKQYFSTRNYTVLVLDDKSSESGDVQLHSIAHGVLSWVAPEVRRSLLDYSPL